MKHYPSKRSYGLLGVIFVLFFGPLLPDVFLGEFTGIFFLLLLFQSLAFALILDLFLNTRYTIDGTTLKIKCGLISYKHIDINEIKTITKTNSLMASPAPSFDRIEIKYGNFEEIIISPKDKVNFARHLTAINPGIKNNI